MRRTRSHSHERQRTPLRSLNRVRLLRGARRAAAHVRRGRGAVRGRQAETKIVRSRAREIERTLRLIDKAKDELERRLDGGDADVKVSDLWNLIRAERLLTGETTDRIEVREVRLLFSAQVRSRRPVRRLSAAAEFLKELETATAGLLELEPGDAELDGGSEIG